MDRFEVKCCSATGHTCKTSNVITAGLTKRANRPAIDRVCAEGRSLSQREE